LIIKSLTLQNIRSYKESTINFPQGLTLFEGDIGSGKSTILMALEFALFGLGSATAPSLLRAKESSGAVSLIFDVAGEEYIVNRSLERKGPSIQQGGGSLKGPDGVIPLSASELKIKVLKILKFNEPQATRAHSQIFRYAVYTPQEDMKEILGKAADKRLETLRKALRVEEYKTARDNSISLANSLKSKATELGGQSSDLETKNAQLEKNERQIAKDTEDERRLGEEAKLLGERIRALDDELSSLRDQEGKLSQNKLLIPELEDQISRLEKEMGEAEERAFKAHQNLDEWQAKIEQLPSLEKPTEKPEAAISEEMELLRKDSKRLRDDVATKLAKLRDFEHIHQEGVCPTCETQVDAQEFTAKLNQKKEDWSRAKQEADSYEQKLEAIEQLSEALKEYNRSIEKLSEYKERITLYNETIQREKEKTEELQPEKKDKQDKLNKALEEQKELAGVSARLEPLQDEKKQVEEELENKRRSADALSGEIRSNKKNIVELKEEIANKQSQLNRANVLSEYKIWLDDYFAKALDSIEKHVMSSYQQEFNEHFQRFFASLVEDETKDARIDDDFTPLIEQDGWEMNLDYLSGGERTSVALAYRLALNILVRKTTGSMDSNLLILDEPTDGFSREQLEKVRDIFIEIQCPQVIIVSHERDLESFAGQVFAVTKNEGISTVEPVTR